MQTVGASGEICGALVVVGASDVMGAAVVVVGVVVTVCFAVVSGTIVVTGVFDVMGAAVVVKAGDKVVVGTTLLVPATVVLGTLDEVNAEVNSMSR